MLGSGLEHAAMIEETANFWGLLAIRRLREEPPARRSALLAQMALDELSVIVSRYRGSLSVGINAVLAVMNELDIPEDGFRVDLCAETARIARGERSHVSRRYH